MTKNKERHFVDNKKFYEAIVEHYKKVDEAKKNGDPEPRLSEYIGQCIYNIAERLTYHRWFINYSPVYKEEMIGDGIENCILYFHNFNPKKYNNPFAYFTQVIYYAFRRRIMKEEKLRYTMYKHAEKFMIENNTGELTEYTMYDNINDFIEKYEEKEEEKKQKRKKKNAKKK